MSIRIDTTIANDTELLSLEIRSSDSESNAAFIFAENKSIAIGDSDGQLYISAKVSASNISKVRDIAKKLATGNKISKTFYDNIVSGLTKFSKHPNIFFTIDPISPRDIYTLKMEFKHTSSLPSKTKTAMLEYSNFTYLSVFDESEYRKISDSDYIYFNGNVISAPTVFEFGKIKQ